MKLNQWNIHDKRFVEKTSMITMMIPYNNNNNMIIIVYHKRNIESKRPFHHSNWITLNSNRQYQLFRYWIYYQNVRLLLASLKDILIVWKSIYLYVLFPNTCNE